jgi:hypothetical protein
MEQNDTEDTVDDAMAVRRQLTAACAAVDHANSQGLALAVMVFVSEDGERMVVFGLEGIDIYEVLEVAARQQWERTPDQPLRGN